MSSRTHVLVLITVVLLVASCKKTVEGENKAWQRNTQEIQKLATLYPGFAMPLKAQLKQAEAAMEAAKKISDQESAAKSMAAANSLLSGGFVHKLGQVDGKVKGLRSKIVKATTSARDKTDRMAARQVADDAQRVLKNVDRLLRKGATEVAAAEVILGQVQSEIDSARRNLDQVISSAKDKVKAKTEAKAQDKAAAAKVKAEEKAAATWKCSYCDQVNPSGAAKCTNCGAQKP